MNTKYFFWKALFIGGGAALLYWRLGIWLESERGFVWYVVAGIFLLFSLISRMVFTTAKKIPADQFYAYTLMFVIGIAFGLFIGVASVLIIHGILMHPPDTGEGDAQKKQPKAKVFRFWEIE